MPLRLRRSPARALAWGLVVLIGSIDATIATHASLGLLYFVPLVLAGLFLSRREALLLAFACATARVLFGPVGDPLGLADVTLHLRRGLEAPVNGTVSFLAYVTVALLLAKVSEHRQRIDSLDREVETDPLTGLANRRALQRFLDDRRAANEPISVLALDLDHFKLLNEQHGHDAGDRALREVALRIVNQLRGGDLVARTGGEEFVVILRGADAATARSVGERIRQAVRDRPCDVAVAEVQVTISVGMATGDATEALLGSADRALYLAKGAGRDRVEAAA